MCSHPDDPQACLHADAAGHPACGTVVVGVDGRIAACDATFAGMLGWPAQELQGRAFLDVVHPGDRDECARLLQQRPQLPRRGTRVQRRLLARGGATVWVDTGIGTLRDAAGGVTAFRGVCIDISAQRARDEQLALYQAMFEHGGQAQMATDQDNRIVLVNAAFTALTGYALDEVRGRDPRLLASGRTPRATYAAMWQALADDGHWEGELVDRRKDGSHYPKWLSITVLRGADGRPRHYLASFTDISQRKQDEARIAELALRDALTGLYNRLSLPQLLGQALDGARRSGRALAVLSLDMDEFKTVNDTLGHATGDRLLVEAARRLREGTREGEVVARLGGDEFVMVLTDPADAAAAAGRAGEIRAALSEPYHVGERRLHASASIGVALFPDDGRDAEALLQGADTAMHHAKSQGRNNVQFFTAEMHGRAAERLQLDHDLRLALPRKQFELHYQPLLDSRHGHVAGVEALLRWQHPQRGQVPPMAFIPVAEANGMILPIGEWVLDEACRQLRAWRDDGLDVPSVSVNLSAHQLHTRRLLTHVVLTLDRHGLQGKDLHLEITESVVMADPQACIGQLRALRALGVQLSIDDFGTGYSSLSYLKMLPIHTLKLDKSFVRDIEADRNDIAICSATIALAHDLGLSVVGEGVETEAQRRLLTERQCDVLQGYLFCKPLPAEQAQRYMRQAPPRP